MTKKLIWNVDSEDGEEDTRPILEEFEEDESQEEYIVEEEYPVDNGLSTTNKNPDMLLRVVFPCSVRKSPNLASRVVKDEHGNDKIMALYKDDGILVKALEIEMIGLDTFAKIGDGEYIVVEHNGRTYCEIM